MSWGSTCLKDKTAAASFLFFPKLLILYWGINGLAVKNPPAKAEDIGLIPGDVGRSPRGGNGTPLQDSCLGNVIDRGAWWPAAHGVAKSGT